jgi:hypothetical protein
MVQSSNATRLMRIQARPGSLVEARHYRYPQSGWVQPDAIARGIPPDASADLPSSTKKPRTTRFNSASCFAMSAAQSFGNRMRLI